MSCLEEQRIALILLQGSVESNESPASGGDEEKGEQAKVDSFSGPIIHLKLEGVGLEDLQPDMSADNLQWLLSQEKPLMGLTHKSG